MVLGMDRFCVYCLMCLFFNIGYCSLIAGQAKEMKVDKLSGECASTARMPTG